MIYYILKPLIYATFRVFFRKIHYSNRQAIPTDRSILFAVNHPTAFLDPIFVATYMKASTSFLLRGDVFTSPFIKWLLEQIKTIPIFRARDGFTNLKNNQDTFERVYELLRKGEHVLVLAEGQTAYEKRLRPIQKGTARLVTGFYELYPDARICILPIGVNYTESNEFRSEIMASVGTPIMLEDYQKAIDENPRKGVKLMTDEITRQLKNRVIHIDKDEDAPFINRILDLCRNDRHQKIIKTFVGNDVALKEELHIVNKLNKAASEVKADLAEKVAEYDAFLTKNNLNDIGLAKPGFFNVFNTLILILGFPVFLIGYLNNYIPLRLGKYVADAKTTKPAFHSSVRFGIILCSYTFLFLIGLVLVLIFGSWWAFAIWCLLPVTGYLSLLYSDLFVRWLDAFKWRKVTAEERSKQLALRKAIVSVKS